MTPRHRFVCAAFLIGLLGFIPKRATAQDAHATCANAYKLTQELTLQKRYREASQKALVCASQPCAEWARQDCARWFDELRTATPSVVIVLDETPAANVQAYVDGIEVAVGPGHPPVEVDPGVHTIRVVGSGGDTFEQRILLGDGDKGHVVRVPATVRPSARVMASPRTIATVEPGHPAELRRPVPWTFYALGGLGLASLGVFGYAGISGVVERGDLSTCKGTCDADSVERVNEKYAVANWALGISLVALTGAAIVYFARPRAR
jgi:hypothetical protein